jgi:hypothetical protein
MTDIYELYRRTLTTPEQAVRASQKRPSVLPGFFAAQPPAPVQALP